jgi:hypothetical protein
MSGIGPLLDFSNDPTYVHVRVESEMFRITDFSK